MTTQAIPEVVYVRLPMYLQTALELQSKGIKLITSKQLGQRLNITSAVIRKDFSYFFNSGKQGSGYNLAVLTDCLRGILGIENDNDYQMMIIGILARALSNAALKKNKSAMQWAIARINEVKF
jgi:redox-sensing transcriptional repressor